MKNNRVIVSSSPHIRSSHTTQRIMIDVLIALVPSLLCGIMYFGIRAAWITALSVLFCVLFEYAWNKMLHKPNSLYDCSAAVTGVLLAFNMPVTVPWWLPVLGSFMAIVIVKQLFGGLGCNFMNPAVAGRTFLLASWPMLMTRFVTPFSTGFFIGADVISSATPLAVLQGEGQMEQLPSLLAMFLGQIGGCIGETSAAAIVLGGVYLLWRRVITPQIPLSFIGTVAVLTFIFSGHDISGWENMLYNVLSGGLLLGAVFMATDYVTSPISPKGQVIMGIGCGAVTFLIRRFGGYPEGVSYGILLMNVATPLIDRWCRPKKFGYVRRMIGE